MADLFRLDTSQLSSAGTRLATIAETVRSARPPAADGGHGDLAAALGRFCTHWGGLTGRLGDSLEQLGDSALSISAVAGATDAAAADVWNGVAVPSTAPSSDTTGE